MLDSFTAFSVALVGSWLAWASILVLLFLELPRFWHGDWDKGIEGKLGRFRPFATLAAALLMLFAAFWAFHGERDDRLRAEAAPNRASLSGRQTGQPIFNVDGRNSIAANVRIWNDGPLAARDVRWTMGIGVYPARRGQER